MGFDEAQSDPATQEFTLKPSDVTESAAPLQTKLVKFQNINVLTVRVFTTHINYSIFLNYFVIYRFL